MAEEYKCGLGLALSGGGFRASFFHIGVLARLAELDVLRHVEVISTVSGGSIVGAAYYLLLKNLLESKPDSGITQDDYLDIVRRLEECFVSGVQSNLRMQTFVNPICNFKMILPKYSRSDRMGELYDEYFYRPLCKEAAGQGREVTLRDLLINPFGFGMNFDPSRDNVGRTNMVPVLLINATSLNTGRHWRFEATRMGEPPIKQCEAQFVDTACLERPNSWDDIDFWQSIMPLGGAVAASSCVPGIFYPMAISDFYPGARIQLVDGGIFDNQGVAGLTDRGCSGVVVSDASQVDPFMPYPKTDSVSVMWNCMDRLMGRIRLLELGGANKNYVGRSVFVTMARGLKPNAMTYNSLTGQGARTSCNAEVPSEEIEDVTPEVQRLLSRVRTDLDSFCDVEAFSIMHLGYLVSKNAMGNVSSMNVVGEYAVNEAQGHWRFLAVKDLMRKPTMRYLQVLKVAQGKLFKVMFLDPASMVGGLVAGLGLLAGFTILLLWLAGKFASPPLSLKSVVIVMAFLVTFGGSLLQGEWKEAWGGLWGVMPHSDKFAKSWDIIFKAIVPTCASIFVWLYLVVFDRRFLAIGKIDRM